MTAAGSLIMIVEDEKLLLEAINKKLQLSQHQTIPCPSGTEAFAYLEKATRLPSAIWLDYYLKDMNGLEFMQKLKANPAWADIPVLVVSNSADTIKVQQMLDMGAKRYLLKADYRLETLITKLEEMIAEVKKEGASA